MFYILRRVSILWSIFCISIFVFSVCTFWNTLETEDTSLETVSEVLELKLEIKSLKNTIRILEESERKSENLKSETVETKLTEPTKDYEIARRRIGRDVNEFWFFVRSKLEFAENEIFNKSFFTSVIKDSRHRYNAIVTGKINHFHEYYN